MYFMDFFSLFGSSKCYLLMAVIRLAWYFLHDNYLILQEDYWYYEQFFFLQNCFKKVTENIILIYTLLFVSENVWQKHS